MRALQGGILGALLASYAAAKQLTDVFTSINSLAVDGTGPSGNPFPRFDCNVSWVLNPEIAQIGDTFTLDMHDVFTVYRTATSDPNNNLYINTPFDLTANGVQIATCNFYGGGPLSLDSQIQCQVIADLFRYSAIDGTLEFSGIFNTGVTAETLAAANYWQVGNNTITFNGNLSIQVNLPIALSFPGTADAHLWDGLWFPTQQQNLTFFSYSPLQLCGGQGIQSGSFTFSYTPYPPVNCTPSNIEFYVTNQFNSILNPKTAEVIPGLSIDISGDGTTIVASFGALSPGYTFWFSTLLQPVNPWLWNDFEYYTNVICADGTTDSKDQPLYMYPNLGSIVGTGQLYVELTSVWDDCSATQTITSTTTGTDGIITEIIREPNSTLCFSSSSAQESTYGSSSSASPATTTTTWTGAYTTTYYTTGTDSSVTEIVEVPTSSVSSPVPTTATSSTPKMSTIVLTTTSCLGNACSAVPIATGITVVTRTKEGVVTSYTTYCPLATDTTARRPGSGTVVSITSCSESKCSIVPITTRITTVTSTPAGITTTSTTYYPLATAATGNTVLSSPLSTGAAEFSSGVSKTISGNGSLHSTTDGSRSAGAFFTTTKFSLTGFATETTLTTSVFPTAPVISTQEGTGSRLNGMSVLLSLISMFVLAL